MDWKKNNQNQDSAPIWMIHGEFSVENANKYPALMVVDRQI
jgi:hypothetical protein